MMREYQFPPSPRDIKDSYTHNFQTLVKAANLLERRAEDVKSNTDLGANWAIALNWKEDRRYERVEEQDAENLLKAIGDEPNGVLAWIKAYW